MQKKEIYEQIMQSVSTEVKKVLNEIDKHVQSEMEKRVWANNHGIGNKLWNVIGKTTWENWSSMGMTDKEEFLGDALSDALAEIPDCPYTVEDLYGYYKNYINCITEEWFDDDEEHDYLEDLEEIIDNNYGDEFDTYIDSDGLHLTGIGKGQELLDNYRGFEVEEVLISLWGDQFDISVTPADENVDDDFYDSLRSVYGDINDIEGFFEEFYEELIDGAFDEASRIGYIREE